MALEMRLGELLQESKLKLQKLNEQEYGENDPQE
jgi:hypothetical protein